MDTEHGANDIINISVLVSGLPFFVNVFFLLYTCSSKTHPYRCFYSCFDGVYLQLLFVFEFTFRLNFTRRTISNIISDTSNRVRRAPAIQSIGGIYDVLFIHLSDYQLVANL